MEKNVEVQKQKAFIVWNISSDAGWRKIRKVQIKQIRIPTTYIVNMATITAGYGGETGQNE